MNTLIQFLLIAVGFLAVVAVLLMWTIGLLPKPLIFSNVVPGTVTRHPGVIQRRLEAALTARRLLVRKGTAADQILVGTAANKPLGVVDDVGAIGDRVHVRLFGVRNETEIMIAGGEIGVDVDVYAAADGKVTVLPVAAGTYWKVGRSLTAAGADGDEIEIIPVEPVETVVSG